MEIRLYHTLPEEARQIREKVFVQEQHFQEEFDGTDRRAVHLVLYQGGSPAATCRYFQGVSPKEYLVGRMAVLKPFRGQNCGACLLARAEAEIRKEGGEIVRLHAQQRATPFYEKQGYSSYGPVEYEEQCPHVWMRKTLSWDGE